MSSIFTKIINGDIPCYKIAETDKFFAFLDINPLAKAHTLIVPKQEVDYLFDMKPDDVGEIMKYAQVIAQRIKEKTNCKRVAILVLGLDVPHAHIHLVPINTMEDVDLAKEKLKLTNTEFMEIQNQLQL